MEIRCTAAVAATNVTIDRERFGDALTSLLEVIARAEAGKIHLRMKPDLQEVRLLVIADGHHDEVLRNAR